MRIQSYFLIADGLLFPALSNAADDSILPRGTRELGLSGIAFVTHDSPQDLFGVATARAGYYVAARHQIGVDATVFAYSRIQDTYLSGFYRYVHARGDRRIAPFAGAAAGTNLSHFDQFGTQHSL